MKTVKKIALLLILITGLNTANAQLSIGGGLAYNDGINAPGLFAKGEFNIIDNIVLSPSVSYFSGSEARFSGNVYKNNLLALDVNGHYLIEIMQDELNVYPLAGLNYSNYNNGGEDFIFLEDSETRQVDGNALGLNIGAGGKWSFSDQLSVFVELKYVVSDFNQVVLGGGILFEL